MKYLSLLLIGSLLFLSCNKNKIELVKQLSTDYQIIIPDNSDSLINHAANELSKYIMKISGTEIPLVESGNHNPEMKKIFIGSYPEEKQYSPHMVFYKTSDENLIIGGGSPKSVLYSVYTFLENELGCLWLSPDAEKIPQSDEIKISSGIDFEYTPDIETRTVHSKLFYENHDFADKLKVTYNAFPGYIPEARVHTFHRFMPGEEFFEEHPEYYALRNGKRLTTQLCLTNPHVLQIVTDSVRAHFHRHPNLDIISVSQDDNTQYCECEDCSSIDKEEGSHSGTMIRFVNKIAEKFPEKTISTLAYQYTRKPPKTKPGDNVLVTLCSIECDRSKPIEEGCKEFARDLKGWKLLTENIRIWDYTTQFTNFLAPFPNIHTLAPNLRFFRDNNAKWVFEQHSHNPSELFELRSYLTAKLLWNPDLNTDEVIHEFCDAYYHEGGKYVEEYISSVQKEITAVPDFFLFLYGDPSQGFNSFLRPDMLEYYNNLFKEAKNDLEGKPEIIKRIEKAGLSTLYASLEASRANLSAEFKLDIEAVDRLDDFSRICDDASIEYMNEMGYTVEEYIGAYEIALNRSSMPNIAYGKMVEALTSPKKYANEDPMALTDGALGGPSFYSNWLGFEGNDMEVIIDLGEVREIDTVQTAFLQVSNHIVFFPEYVEVSFQGEEGNYTINAQVGRPRNDTLKVSATKPLMPGSKVNDIEYFNFAFEPVETRYIRIYAHNMKKAPEWHNASGLPAWIFCDEIVVN